MDEQHVSVFTGSRYAYSLPNEWKDKAFEELNENPATVRQDVQDFRQSVKEIPGLRSRLDDCFLLAFLRAKKFDKEKSLKTLKRFYEARKMYSNYFKPLLVTKNKTLYYDEHTYVILTERDSLGRTVEVVQVGNWDFSRYTVEDLWRFIFTNCDFFLFDQTFQVGGFVLILDFSKFGIAHLKHGSLTFAKVFGCVFLDTYPIRFKAIHILNTSVYFRALYRLVKPFLSKKINERIIVHGPGSTDYCTYIKRDTLPDAYGGTKPGFDNTWWLKQMEDMEDAIKENATYGYQ